MNLIDDLKIDRIDLKILRSLLRLKKNKVSGTTSTLAKEVFDIKDRNDYQDKDTVIRRRLSKLEAAGLVSSVKGKLNGRKVTKYLINSENIIMGNTKMEIEPDFQDEEKKTLEVKNMLFIADSEEEGSFIIYGHT